MARFTFASGSGVALTHWTSTRHDGVSLGAGLRLRVTRRSSRSSRTSSTVNDAIAPTGTSISRWIVSADLDLHRIDERTADAVVPRHMAGRVPLLDLHHLLRHRPDDGVELQRRRD